MDSIQRSCMQSASCRVGMNSNLKFFIHKASLTGALEFVFQAQAQGQGRTDA